MDVNWSQLQPELVELIANKLTKFIDYIRFRSVCVNWHSTLSPTHRHLPYQFPWLMLPSNSISENCCRFFNLSANKVYRLSLPIPKTPIRCRCCGSSRGWLVFQVENNPCLFLFNPLTSIQIQLPPLTTFSNELEFDVTKVGKEYLLRDSPLHDPYKRSSFDILDSFVKKVVLSSSPTSDEYIILVLLNETGQLVYCKKGFESWKMIDGAKGYSEDVVFYKGLFYAVTKRGDLAICDVTGESPLVTIVTTPPLRRPLPSRTRLVDYDRYYSDELLYLADAFGELLLIARYFEHVMDTEPNMSVYKTVGFDVFRTDPDSRWLIWKKVYTLGGCMLFLGGNSSFCLSATDFSGCEKNCIYFTDYNFKVESNGRRLIRDSGVFNLEDGSIEPLPYCDTSSEFSFPSPIWLLTNPC